MSDKKVFREYMKFFLTHFDDYLDICIGLEDKVYKADISDLKRELKLNRRDFSEAERIEADTTLFMKYLELEQIEFKIEDYVR
jgi:hypothetical protein